MLETPSRFEVGRVVLLLRLTAFNVFGTARKQHRIALSGECSMQPAVLGCSDRYASGNCSCGAWNWLAEPVTERVQVGATGTPSHMVVTRTPLAPSIGATGVSAHGSLASIVLILNQLTHVVLLPRLELKYGVSRRNSTSAQNRASLTVPSPYAIWSRRVDRKTCT